jgi:Tfp pilus assembly protein PilF
MQARSVVLRNWILLIVALLAAGCARKDPAVAAREYVQSGDAYVAQKKLKEAIIEYRNAVNAMPSLAEAHYKLAKTYDDTGDPVSAYASYARTADLNPSNLDAQLRAGTLLLVAGEYDAARSRAELAIQADPRSAPAHILLGNAMAGLNNPTSATTQIEQAINLDPNYAPAWTSLGAAHFRSGRREDARAAFNKATALSPKAPDVWIALANFEWASGDSAAAEKALQRALSVDPQSPDAHRALALLYITTRRTAEAEPHFKALTTQPGGQLALADYYIGVGRNDQALALLREVSSSQEKEE